MSSNYRSILNAQGSSFASTNSFTFDGNSDFIDCSSAASSISADNEGTISVWVQPNDIVNGQRIICFSASTQTRQYLNLTLTASGFQVDMRTSSFSTTGFSVITDVNPFSLGTWIHLAIVQDGVSPQLYVDGVAVAQTFTVPDNDQKWLNDMGSFDSINIGRLFTSDLDQNYFDGLVDEVSYFSSALSSTDIETIYNNGVPNNLNELSTLPTIWYRMGEEATFDGSNWTLTDQGSGGNNATTQNMAEASRVLDVPPTFNTKSILLDGIDDAVVIGTASLGITSTISVSAWVKIPTTNTGGGGTNIQVIIAEDTTGSGQRNWNLFWRGGGIDSFYFAIHNTNLSSSSAQSVGVTPNSGQWIHILATYDGTANANGIKLYIDGVPNAQGTASSTGINSFTSSEPNIGRLTGQNQWNFEGNIDEVSVWNSELSASDVTSIYNSGVPNNLNDLSTPPLSWWRCGDGDTSPTLTDNGSGGNDGTMTNFTTFSTDVPT